MIVGFTGTRDGMTLRQYWSLLDWVEDNQLLVTEAHHGCCVGADADFVLAVIRGRIGETRERTWAVMHAHPSTLPGMTDPDALKLSDFNHDPLPPLERNRVIVDACDVLLACPKSAKWERSGTWATIGYARKTGTPVVIFSPDGRAEEKRDG